MLKVIFDTDPGVDDALALLYLHKHAQIDLIGVTTTFGNASVESTTHNALYLKQAWGFAAPVARGAGGPLQPEATPEAWPVHIHGHNGLGNHPVPASLDVAADTRPAHQLIIDLVRAHPGEVTLVAVGRMTNLALALQQAPDIAGLVRGVVIMGGAFHVNGNITPAAEFNIAFDPEAAHVVFGQFPKIELADWEAVLAHGFLHADVERWLAADSVRARFYAAISAHTRAWSRAGRGERWHAADALAMALALQPEGVQESVPRPLAVEVAGIHTRGATVVDWNRQTGRADNVDILLRYDQARFETMIAAALAA